MLSWASILYGAALSAVVAGAALTALTHPRQPVLHRRAPAAAAGQLARHRLGRIRSRRHRPPPRARIPGHRPGPTHHRAGRTLRPGRIPGRRLPVLTEAVPSAPRPLALHA